VEYPALKKFFSLNKIFLIYIKLLDRSNFFMEIVELLKSNRHFCIALKNEFYFWNNKIIP